MSEVKKKIKQDIRSLSDEVERLTKENESMADMVEFFGEQNEKLVIENRELKRKLKGKMN